MSDFFTIKETQEGLTHICGSGKISKNLEKLLLSAYRHIDRIAELDNKLNTDSQNFQIECQKEEIKLKDKRITKLEQLGNADHITKLQARLDAVKPYIRHKPDCNKMAVKRIYDAHCDCGLRIAIGEGDE